MSWLGKTPANIVVSGQQLANGTITAIKLAAGAVAAHLGYTPANDAALAAIAKSGLASDLSGVLAKARLPAGSVLQVVQSVKTDTWVNTSGDTYTQITGLTPSITPRDNNSKVLVVVALGAVSMYSAAIQLLRNGSVISGAIGDAASTRPRQTARATFQDGNHPNDLHFTYLDSPATASSVTYGVGASGYGSYPFYLNRSQNDVDTTNTYGGRTISTVTLLEIAG